MKASKKNKSKKNFMLLAIIATLATTTAIVTIIKIALYTLNQPVIATATTTTRSVLYGAIVVALLSFISLVIMLYWSIRKHSLSTKPIITTVTTVVLAIFVTSYIASLISDALTNTTTPLTFTAQLSVLYAVVGFVLATPVVLLTHRYYNDKNDMAVE